MVKSMTGYGSSVCTGQGRSYSIDVKSVNSKTLDINIKLPNELRNRELEIRSIISSILERGKIDFTIVPDQGSAPLYELDTAVVATHYEEIKRMTADMRISLSDADIMAEVLRMSDVLVAKKNVTDDEMWQMIASSVREACVALDVTRQGEGEALEADFAKRIHLISSYVEEVEAIEMNRVDVVKNRLLKQLSTLEQSYDENRFEQELIFYLEKYDFTEEKVRLRKHCNYFMDTMAHEEQSGKKLTFISQEIGREINTLGSKASDADVQKIVVQMKDELEKVKEQLANVL